MIGLLITLLHTARLLLFNFRIYEFKMKLHLKFQMCDTSNCSNFKCATHWSPQEDDYWFTSQQLVNYIRYLEENSHDRYKYYSLQEDSFANLIFTAKTPCGAVFKIFRYMQDKHIPLWDGEWIGTHSDDITDLICDEPIDNLEEFKDFCEKWINEKTTCLEVI